MANHASTTTPTGEHPEPPVETAERMVFRVQTLALLRVLGPKKGKQFLHAMADIMGYEASYAELIPLYGPRYNAARRDVIREAASVLRDDLFILGAGLAGR
jgi:hypothetical protein